VHRRRPEPACARARTPCPLCPLRRADTVRVTQQEMLCHRLPAIRTAKTAYVDENTNLGKKAVRQENWAGLSQGNSRADADKHLPPDLCCAELDGLGARADV